MNHYLPSRPFLATEPKPKRQPRLLAHAKRELVIELWSIGPALWFIDIETDDGQPVRQEGNQHDRSYSSAAEALAGARSVVKHLKATSKKGAL